ncbi:MAG: hypothetical protein SGBAC_004607 [Bacillariaceae sp.]
MKKETKNFYVMAGRNAMRAQKKKKETKNYYVMAGRNVMRAQKEKEQQDIEAQRAVTEPDGIFKRIDTLETKLLKQTKLLHLGMAAMIALALCILLSIWLIPKHHVPTTSIGSRVDIEDMDSAFEAYKNGSVIFFEGKCIIRELNTGTYPYDAYFSYPVSIASSATYWAKARSNRNIYRTDGSLLVSIECLSNPGECSVRVDDSICN